MKKSLVFLALAALAGSTWAAAAGSNEKQAVGINVGNTKKVKLVEEYDPEFKEYMGSGVYYMQVTLKRGKTYTFYYEGGDAEELSLSTYPRDATDSEWERDIYPPSANFDDSAVQDSKYMNWLYSTDWWEDDQASWKYYICLEGDIGAQTTVHLVEGYVSFLSPGLAENPLVITVGDKEQKFAKKFTEESAFFFETTLQGGRKYLVRIEGGSEGSPYSLGVSSDDMFEQIEDTDYDTSINDAWMICPEEGGTYTFEAGGGIEGDNFTMICKAVTKRAIANHPWEDIANGGEDTFQPGRMVADKQYYDDIVDEWLYRVNVAKGDKWVFNAVGADIPVKMNLYDKNGNIIAENETIGDGSNDLRIGYEFTTAGYYYIGVYDPSLTMDDAPVCSEVTLTAKKITTDKDEPVAISPVPGKEGDRPTEVGSEYGPYSLSETKWTQTFVVGGRKGITYSLATKDAEVFSDHLLWGEVYTLSGTKETIIGSGYITPGDEFIFTADKNAAYYVRISVAEGVALDYPGFYLYALAYTTDGEDLGILQVFAYGTPEARWYIDSEKSTLYPSGTALLVNGTHKVNFNTVKNFKSPAAIDDVEVQPGTEPTVVEAYYSDTFDPVDDETQGSEIIDGKLVTYKPTALSLKSTATSVDRTLWADDPADNFTFDGVDGYLYDFKLENVSGDAYFAITNATPYQDEGGIFVLAAQEVTKLALPKTTTKYVLRVYHGELTPSNGCYTLTGKYANVGAIKFAKTEVTVNENAAVATLSVTRTAKDGRVRVKYQTIADTAKPGEDYFAQEGILEWEDGDNKAKTIDIKLIPDLIETYEGENKQFEVKLTAIPEDERDDDEYEAIFTIDAKTGEVMDTATVTLKETTKATAGTIQVANTTMPKKPVFDVVAGDKLTLQLERTNGAAGEVSVIVDASALDLEKETLTWEDGEIGIKELKLEIPTDASDYKTTKKATIKLSAATTKVKPTFAATSITVNIQNDKFAMTAAEWAKTLPKEFGVQAKEAKSGKWFLSNEGKLFTTSEGEEKINFTVTGPCTFKYRTGAEEDWEFVSVAAGKTETVVIAGTLGDEIEYEYIYNGGKYETILQGVKYGYGEPFADAEEKGLKVAVGKLPAGITLTQDRTTREWFVSGTPKTPGYYYAEIQNSAKEPVGEPLAFMVEAAGTSIGTFNGIICEDGAALTNAFPSVGTILVTTTTAGSITAKVTVGGGTYNFKTTGFDSAEEKEQDGSRTLTAYMEAVGKKVGTVTYTNALSMVIKDADVNDIDNLKGEIGEATMTFAIPDAKGVQEEIVYTAKLYRDNTKESEYLEAFKPFAGYYTVGLPIDIPESGKPMGNGYVTMTLKDTGKATVAGKLADGTSISCALTPAILSDGTLAVPVFVGKSPMVFGGYLHVIFDEETGMPVVDSTETLIWGNDNASLTYEGEDGWKYDLIPCGGWYDTVYNLQTYYLNYDFEVDAGDTDELPEELLADGYEFVNSTMPTGESMELQGNNAVVEKQVLVKDLITKLYDFEASVNPSNLKLTFKRATGVISGTFELWSEGENAKGDTVQKKISGFKHEGIMIFSRDALSPLDGDIWSVGYYLAPAATSSITKKKCTLSYQFNIKAIDKGDIDHWEQDGGWNPEWGEEPIEE